jgi:predicted  nucleic acid-binding Zn-ribbon protein
MSAIERPTENDERDQLEECRRELEQARIEASQLRTIVAGALANVRQAQAHVIDAIVAERRIDDAEAILMGSSCVGGLPYDEHCVDWKARAEVAESQLTAAREEARLALIALATTVAERDDLRNCIDALVNDMNTGGSHMLCHWCDRHFSSRESIAEHAKECDKSPTVLAIRAAEAERDEPRRLHAQASDAAAAMAKRLEGALHEPYKMTQRRYEDAKAEVAALRAKLDEAEARIAELEIQRKAWLAQDRTQDADLATARARINDLERQLSAGKMVNCPRCGYHYHRVENDYMHDLESKLATARAAIERKDERIETLEAALRPFAKMYRDGDEDRESEMVCSRGIGCDRTWITISGWVDAFRTLAPPASADDDGVVFRIGYCPEHGGRGPETCLACHPAILAPPAPQANAAGCPKCNPMDCECKDGDE